MFNEKVILFFTLKFFNKVLIFLKFRAKKQIMIRRHLNVLF